LIGAGCGDNAGAALGLSMGSGVFIMSLGTSGVISVSGRLPVHDPTGLINGFADATGGYLPLACTLNATRTLDVFCEILGVDQPTLSDMALKAKSGAGGLVLVPYLEGERMPNEPNTTGSLHGLTLGGASRENVARAVVEGMLCGVGAGIDALMAVGLTGDRVCLIGGGARSEAVRSLAPEVLGLPVVVPESGEYVADGAARQAAWALSAQAEPPAWPPRRERRYEAKPTRSIRERYEAVRSSTISRSTLGLVQ
jgi:xylulokinase